jgi:2-(1,2-epoxy-1,2-dihydrophenyl)acetyl-CoA isomerase
VTYESILHESAAGIARLTLNRPDRLNSFTAKMHEELRDALARVRADASARVLLLTGAGRGFCAGQDLSDRAVAPGSAPVDLGASIEANYRPLILALKSFPMPVVCAVNGVAAGAGANIALACDLVIAARSASSFRRSARSASSRLRRHVLPAAPGRDGARDGTRTARRQAPGAAAADWGLIWKCVDDADLAPTVEALLRNWRRHRPGAGATRRALHGASAASLETQLDLEGDLQRELGYSADYREGVAAFLDKRPPRFTGK